MLKQYPTVVHINTNTIQESYFNLARLYWRYVFEDTTQLKRREKMRREKALKTLRVYLSDLETRIDGRPLSHQEQI